MNAGLPGTGLGGLFYIASALFMPLHRAVRGGGHSGRAWRRVLGQAGMALGIVATLFATGLALGLLFTPDPATVAAGRSVPLSPVFGVLGWLAIIGTLGLLALLLLAVELAGAVLGRRRGSGRGRAELRARSRQRRARERTAAARRVVRRGDGGSDEDLPRVA